MIDIPKTMREAIEENTLALATTAAESRQYGVIMEIFGTANYLALHNYISMETLMEVYRICILEVIDNDDVEPLYDTSAFVMEMTKKEENK